MKTINKIFLILFFSLIASTMFAKNDLSFGFRSPEVPIDTFVQRVERAGRLTATIQAADGGYVTASSINYSSVLVVRKIKATGQKEWERTLSLYANTHFNNPEASVNGIAQTTDGGFVLAGKVGCDYQCWDNGSPMLIKLRSNGTLQWKRSFAVDGITSFIFSSTTPMSDGGVVATGVILTGEKANQFLAVRVSATGNVVWRKSFESLPRGNVFGSHSVTTVDKGVILSFTTLDEMYKPNGVEVIKIADSGIIVWKTFLKADFAYPTMGAAADNGVILVGACESCNKLLVIALKADGTLSWKKGYSLRLQHQLQFVSSPALTKDGGYVVTGGGYDSSDQKSYGFILKIDSTRKIVFQNTFGLGEAYGKSIFATPDGGFLLFANEKFNILILKVNRNGIVPGCFSFLPLGETTPTPFGALKMGEVKITPSNHIPIVPSDFVVTSVVTDHSVSTVCQ